jgi:Trypsin
MFSKTFVGTQMRISGWGSTYYGGPVSPQLRTAFVTGMSNTDCQSRYSAAGLGVTQRMMCATTPAVDTDACQGDSGSKTDVFLLIYLPFTGHLKELY